MKFDFSPGKGTKDAVFAVKYLQEKCMEKQKNLYLTFVDLEKPYDRVPRELQYWCLCKKDALDQLIKLIEATF